LIAFENSEFARIEMHAGPHLPIRTGNAVMTP